MNFFDVNVSLSVPVGLYSGSFSVLGGENNLAQNVLGTAPFSVFVVGAGQPLPEPATMFLLATGLGRAAALTRRRAKRKGKDGSRHLKAGAVTQTSFMYALPSPSRATGVS